MIAVKWLTQADHSLQFDPFFSKNNSSEKHLRQGISCNIALILILGMLDLQYVPAYVTTQWQEILHKLHS